MRIKKTLAVLLVVVLLSGCSAVSNIKNNIVSFIIDSTINDVELYEYLTDQNPSINKSVVQEISGSGEAIQNEDNLPQQEGASQPDVLQSPHTALSPQQYYGYRNLDDTGKALYQKMVSAIEQCKNFVNIADLKVSKAQFLQVFQSVIQDNPQFFYLSKGYQYKYYNDDPQRPVVIMLSYFDGTTTDSISSDYTFDTLANRDIIFSQRQEYARRINEVLNSIPVEASQLEKELLAHDFVVGNITYDYAAAENLNAADQGDSHSFSSYGALLNGLAVCEGYSELLQNILYAMGMDSLIVIGQSGGQPHQWNLVQIDGQYYHVDPTWNDSDIFEDLNTNSYYYFNMSDKMISRDHTIGGANPDQAYGYTLPPAPVEDRYYYSTIALEVDENGAIPTNFAQRLQHNIDSGSPYLVVLFSKSWDTQQIKQWLTANIWEKEGAVQAALALVNQEATQPIKITTAYYSVPQWSMAVLPLELSKNNQ